MYDKYIGIPYLENGRSEAGLDCWGLARLFYKNEFGIDLPSYSEEYMGSYDPKVVAAITTYKNDWTKTTSPKLGDLCLFKILGEPTHVGIYLENSKFLHARDGHSSVIESLKRINWTNRLEGFYTYSPVHQNIQLAGSPHPFKVNRILDWAASGITIKQCVDYLQEKYKVSERLVKQIIVAVDGVVIPKDRWTNTVLQAGQTVTYKTVPQGRQGLRVALFIAVMIFAQQYAPQIASSVFGTTATWAVAVTQVAITMAGAALINALVPIRPPKLENDSVRELNLFSGTSNRANPYGAIPVILGKVRMTPPLGSQPYAESQTSTSYMNMQLVWGFGPLKIEDICIGANVIEDYYQNNTQVNLPLPAHVYGYLNSDGTERETNEITRFNTLYPNIVEQQFKNVELVYTTTPSLQNEEVITFTETEATRVEVILSFPEGMRKIYLKDGKSAPTSATFEVNLERISSGAVVGTTGRYELDSNFISMLDPSSYITQETRSSGDSGDYLVDVAVPVYRKTVFCLTPENRISVISGAASTTNGANPSGVFLAKLKSNTFTNLVDASRQYLFDPEIPLNYIKLYSVIQYGSDDITTTNELTGKYTYNGLAFSRVRESVTTTTEGDSPTTTTTFSGKVTITITAGTIGSASSGSYKPTSAISGASSQLIFSTRQLTSIVNTSNNKVWSKFMNDNSVWYGTGQTFDQQKLNVNFPYDGIYTISFAVDNTAAELHIGSEVIPIPQNSYRDAGGQTITRYIDHGFKTVRVKAENYAGEVTRTDAGYANAGVAVLITFSADNVTNFVPGTNYITIGDNEFVSYKDGFNYPINFDELTPGQYRVRVRRTSTSDPDHESEHRHYFKSQFLSAACFKAGTTITPPAGVGIARTAIRLESSGRVNGTIDGVNALVTTIGYDFLTLPGGTTKAWVPEQPINNPASLFVHVLLHRANAYRILDSEMWSKIDKVAIEEWHTYCDTDVVDIRPKLTYNGIVTGNISVMDVLRDICAAGMASPVFIDGKWSVIIDKARPHVIQHFTPHNSWGFEATKNLPKIPDAFRVNFPDEANAYQQNEILVANFGLTKDTAKVIEEINLPGITRIEQARYFARWHFAQLRYRPEIYTINTDFEYLVCTRGDRVKVTHDIPLWGTGSGRIKAITNTTTLVLTEPVLLEANASYQILIRTNNLTTTPGSGSLTRNITGNTTTNYYNTITLSSAIDSSVEVDNLFMIGLTGKVTQDLLVQSIEPSTNNSAKITLVEYNEALYTYKYRPYVDGMVDLPAYIANINKRTSLDLIKNSITDYPRIVSFETKLSEEISAGNFQNIGIITFGHPVNLPVIAEKIEVQGILASEVFNNVKQPGTAIIDKTTDSYTVKGLQSGTIYKVRARYRNTDGTITGPWSPEVTNEAIGHNYNIFAANTLTIEQQGTNVIVKPYVDLDKIENASHSTYEFRLYRNTGSGDFWNTAWDTANMLKHQDKTRGVFNLFELSDATPRITETAPGIKYRIAVKAIDKTNNYSTQTLLGEIYIRTIQPPTLTDGG